jgi:exopolysaccharide production protein ExoY
MTDATLGRGPIGSAAPGELTWGDNLARSEEAASSGLAIQRASRDEKLLLSFAYRLIALCILLMIAPLMVAIAVAVFVHDRGPVFFAHTRIGQGGRPFKCLKFRSMCADAERRLAAHLASDPNANAEWQCQQKLRNDPRVTGVGRFLRRSSLDELPQLINVVRGEMSLVGPRPIVQAEIAKYRHRFKAYASVKPGITGLWQVMGRNDAKYSTRIALDCLYVSRRCAALDVVILLRTIPSVILYKGPC